MKVEDYIKQHNHINYCEAIIFPDGSIEDCIPSHQLKLISIINKSRNELSKIIPIEADPTKWLICYTQTIAIWYNFGIFNKLTKEQIKTIKLLKENNIINSNFQLEYTIEKEHLEEKEKLFNNEISIYEFENNIKKMRKEKEEILNNIKI